MAGIASRLKEEHADNVLHLMTNAEDEMAKEVRQPKEEHTDDVLKV